MTPHRSPLCSVALRAGSTNALPTREDRPAAEDAAEATRNSIALADGLLWPCWSWDGESKLWSGKFDLAGNGVDGL